MELQAGFWYKEHKFEEAKSEALCAVEVYEKIGATGDVEDCRKILRDIEEQMEKLAIPGEQDFGGAGEPTEMMRLPTAVNVER